MNSLSIVGCVVCIAAASGSSGPGMRVWPADSGGQEMQASRQGDSAGRQSTLARMRALAIQVAIQAGAFRCQ